MQSDDTAIALDRFLIWIIRGNSAEHSRAAEDSAKPSLSIRLCLTLIYYFTLCDTVLKFFPLGIAIVLRYLPEALLYLFVFILLMKKWRIVSFPLFWPLCACALTMAISGLLNSSSMFGVIADYRLFFRFAAFTYIGWRTTVTPQRIYQFIKGFLGLTIIELVIGGLELVGGDAAQHFFSPVLGLISGTPGEAINQVYGESGFIFGTMSEYNQYGMFMTISCVLAIASYFIKRSHCYLWLAIACVLGVVVSFSRHSYMMLVLALVCILLLRQRSIAVTILIRNLLVVLLWMVAIFSLVEHFNPDFGERLATINGDQLDSESPANMRLLMTVELTPRFLSAYPFFGQGPIAASDAVPFGDTDPYRGVPLKAAPDLPPQFTRDLGDVVWVMILGLYGCFGLAAFAFVLWSIAAAADRVRRRQSSSGAVVLAQACLVSIVPFVVSGFFSEEMVTRDTIPVFWTLAGLVLSLVTNPSSNDDEVRDKVLVTAEIIS